MLNLSDNHINKYIQTEKYDSFSKVENVRRARILSYWLLGFLAVFIIALFLPWTQNIRAKGKLTTLRPEHRPQTIHSTIAGRIERWYVVEGDTVSRGDTIVFLSEIKDDYFDPKLLQRTDRQIDAKESAMGAYNGKARALSSQIDNLHATLKLKLSETINKIEQTRLKVQADSADLVAVSSIYEIAVTQFNRWDTLYKQGLKSRTDWEKKRYELQEAQAKLVSQRNKLNISRSELLNTRINYDNLSNEYFEKIAKAESDRQSALSDLFDTEAQVAKMENSRSNYAARIAYRYIIAPQNGVINRALKPGIGETVKEGEAVVSILPQEFELAAEIFVRPVDLPLIQQKQHVRLEFDGWPTLIFGAGWPNLAFGTFGGEVFAIENTINADGLYRVLIAPSKTEPWPTPLRPGSGTNAFALLKDVPLWYEIWRQLNGFPPDFYVVNSSETDSSKPVSAKK